MQANDQTSLADKASTSKTDSNPKGLVKGVLNGVLNGKESAVFVPKVDSTVQDSNEKSHEDEKNVKHAPETSDNKP